MTTDDFLADIQEGVPSDTELEELLKPAPSGVKDFSTLGLLLGGALLLGTLHVASGKKQTFVPGKVENVTSLGKAIRQRRTDLKLTQEQLAEQCGVGPRFVSEVENGKPRAEIAKIFLLLDALDLQLGLSVRK